MSSSRRNFLAAASTLGAVSLSGCATSQVVPSPATRKTFVLAHGSWHGGWCWTRVAERLRKGGHQVHTPSYTGMGDRAHLLSKNITIETFVQDLVSVIESNELSDVILVGHSFGGVPITGVADRIPNRLKQLVYLDAVVLESGKSAFSVYPPEEAAARIRAAEQASGGLAVPVPPQLPEVWGLKAGTADYAWVARRLTAQPLQTYTTALSLRAPIGNSVSKTYIECVQPKHPALAGSKALLRTQPGWKHVDFAGPHDAMITHPKELTELLLGIAA